MASTPPLPPIPRQKNNRKVYLINPRFQLRFTGVMTGIAFAAILIFFIANTYFFYTLQQLGREAELGPAYFQFLAGQQEKMNWIFLATSVVALLAMLVGGLWLSHRVAGPLYRFTRHLEQVGESGELRTVKFRKGDFFPEIADVFNRYMERLKKVV